MQINDVSYYESILIAIQLNSKQDLNILELICTHTDIIVLAGVDFFSQQFLGDKPYLLCPPVSFLTKLFQYLQQQKKVHALIIFPVWMHRTFNALYLSDSHGKEFVQQFVRFRCQFDVSGAPSLFSYATNFDMMGLVYTRPGKFHVPFPFTRQFDAYEI